MAKTYVRPCETSTMENFVKSCIRGVYWGTKQNFGCNVVKLWLIYTSNFHLNIFLCIALCLYPLKTSETLKLTHFFPMFPCDPPKNIRKHQGGQKGALGRKGLTSKKKLSSNFAFLAHEPFLKKIVLGSLWDNRCYIVLISLESLLFKNVWWMVQISSFCPKTEGLFQGVKF